MKDKRNVVFFRSDVGRIILFLDILAFKADVATRTF